MQRLFRLFGLVAVLAAGWLAPAHAQSGGEQTISTRLTWDTYADLATASGSTRKVPTFRGAYHGPGEAAGTLTLRLPGTVATGAVRDAVYEPFPAADEALLRTATLH
jgi:hypothetical protein